MWNRVVRIRYKLNMGSYSDVKIKIKVKFRSWNNFLSKLSRRSAAFDLDSRIFDAGIQFGNVGYQSHNAYVQ